jgi:hypothetical protein
VLTRKDSWQLLLHQYLCACREKPFRYGAMDCCLFVCDAIEAMTGVDVAAPLRGQYSSRKQAFRAIEKYAGHPSVQAVTERVTRDHEMPEVTPLLAQRGDVVLLERSYDFSLALVGLDGAILAAAAVGFEHAPLSLATRAWRV